MRIHQELTIVGDSDTLLRFIAALDEGLGGGWVRDKSTEESMGRGIGPVGYCYRRPRGAGFALLWLSLDRSERQLWVSNIVPNGDPIERDEYNVILNEFYDTVVKTAAAKVGVDATLSRAEVDLSDYLTEPAFVALRAFSNAANRSALHPLDRKRWWSFVIRTHMDVSDVPDDLLERWFTEVEGWPEDRGSELAGDFEHLRAFLAYYDGRS